MTEKRLNLNIRGVNVPMTIRFRIRNWRYTLEMEQLKIKDPTWLVQYDKGEQVATVDAEAPSWYIDLAVLHDTICCGGLYIDDINRLTDFHIANDNHRYANTERFIIAIAGKHRREYIDARIRAYSLMLEKKLNPARESEMREALSLLKNW